jgi:S1-C subfamily serine protease
MSSHSPRRTRLRAKNLNPLDDISTTPTTNPPQPLSAAVLPPNSVDAGQHTNTIQPLPALLTTAHTKLPRPSHQLLLRKQAHLQKYSISLPRDFRKHSSTAVSSTLVFAQEEAGTAVCVSPSGLLLTCAHCVADDDEEPGPEALHWLLFASGRTVAARCVAWDERRDLALLRVVAAQAGPTGEAGGPFPYVEVAEIGRSLGDKFVCVGHPGSEDFEAEEPGVQTGYDVLHLSTGTFRGYAEGQDLQDNSEIGALQHDCWTYWGHSGAPLFERRSGRLVGLHSSWDDETAMRRGVALEAILAFMHENKQC